LTPPSLGDPFVFNFLLNVNDGKERNFYEYSPGIGGGKMPFLCHKVLLK